MEPEWLTKARAEGRITEKGVNTAPLQGAARSGEKQIELAKAALAGCSEAQFQQIVIDFAQARNWRVGHFRKVRVQRKDGTVFWETPVAANGTGFLDLELVKGTRLLKVELKVGKNKPTPEQLEWIAAYKAAGVWVAVWRPEMWDEIVTELEKPT